jgi:hypothetical protein
MDYKIITKLDLNITKQKAYELFQQAFMYQQDQPELVWEYLCLYRRLLGENEHN